MAEVSWDELQTGSDLFSWFALVETDRHTDGDRTWVAVSPRVMAESVRLRFALDRSENVLAFQLAIDRQWLDGEATAMANAGDLAKSVVERFARVDPVMAQVAHDLSIGSFHASPSPVVIRGSQEAPTGRPDIAALVDVLTSTSAPPATMSAVRTLSAENVSSGNRLWFVLSWGAVPEPPDRWY